jgi:hypothetical protein
VRLQQLILARYFRGIFRLAVSWPIVQ